MDKQEANNKDLKLDPKKEIFDMVEPLDPEKPDNVLFHFFLNLLVGECGVCWKLLSRYSQQKILDTMYEEMQELDEFYLQDEITRKEDLRRAFEENHKGLKERFWFEYAVQTGTEYMVEYGEYRAKSVKNNKTIVEIVFKRKDGIETRLPYQMVYEDTSWKFGLVESSQDT